MAQAALYLASEKNSNATAKRIEDDAVLLIQRWLNDDNRELVRRTNRALNYNGNRKVPDVDYTTLPWGAVAHQLTDSGVINSQSAVMIEQTGADSLLNTSEAANELLRILNYVADKWGLHGLVWFVASINNDAGPKMRELGIELNSTDETRIRRIIQRIKREVQNTFKEN